MAPAARRSLHASALALTLAAAWLARAQCQAPKASPDGRRVVAANEETPMKPDASHRENTGPASETRPPLDPETTLPRRLAPYDLVKLNYLGMNYCENLLDARVNVPSYSHLNYDANHLDAWHLQFPDDCARLLEAVAWEAEFSPVARVELARRLTKGIIAAHYPGTKAYYAFRHRSGGKTFLIFDDEPGDKAGRLTLSTWGDTIEGAVKVGFRAQTNGEWLEINRFKHEDDPQSAGSPGIARSERNWHRSPFVFKRHYAAGGTAVDFTGRYWLSDEDMPIEYGFASADADVLQIAIGEPGKPMPLLVDSKAPGIIHLPDRTTTFSSEAAGDKVFERPRFSYFILRKRAAWATWGYSSALLVMWQGRPDRIEALKDNGYGEIRFSYARKNGRAGGRVWLYPFTFVNDVDMEYLYRNAEHFLSEGKLIHRGFPSQQLLNAIPAGLAAGAYLLTRYDDPCATTARIHAENAVDELFEGEENGRRLMRAFFPVRAAAWMVKLGKALGDERMVAKYTALLERAVKRMCSPELGYDGKGWPGGWDHFNSTKALWLAYDATGGEEYRDARQRALSVYTIDEKGIYRYGERMAAPGGFDTYSGALPLGVWGNAGMMENVNRLINLDVPNGWYSELPVKDTWNDTGAGPWAQDDANPEYLGISLKGAKMPQTEKRVIPVGAFPIYHADGGVELTNQPIVENPFFRRGRDKPRIVPGSRPRIEHHVSTLTVTPGDANEKAHLVRVAGGLAGGRRVCTGSHALVYRFDTTGAIGAGVDLHVRGRGYKMEVSPDGKRWYDQLDTWSGEFRNQSADLSYLTGGYDELLKMLVISASNDEKYLTDGSRSWVDRGGCRYVTKDGSFVYRLDLPSVVECHLEVLAGNGYRIECSSDGKAWREALNAAQVMVRKGLNLEDAAWFHLLDVTPYLRKGSTVYFRFSDIGTPEVYAGKTAFLQRLTVYGVFDSDQVYVKLANVRDDPNYRLELGCLTFRTWSN